ncbi:hemolysin family protein [Helcococcus massiliensis]|uniref:hemolysin family protein n=1 Tax=Helcococcus massiliensis TaxID=2040290 RepID=UPI00190E7602|nr:hemolysin family protein [Helcococcus massiliensis]
MEDRGLMDSDQLVYILIFFACVAMSAFFSSSETAFTSLKRAKLDVLVKQGDKKAKKTLKLHDRYDDLLSTILIGNNLVNITASAVATVFFVNIFPLYGALISTIVTTILLLIFSEISPKLVAKIMPEDIALRFTPVLNFVMKLLYPLVLIMGALQNALKKIIPSKEEAEVSEDILQQYIDVAKEEGSIEDDEHTLVTKAMDFDDENVENIITPRVDVIAIDIDEDEDEIEALFDEYSYSRLIVYEETIDKVIGQIHEKDFNKYLRMKLRGNHDLKIRDIITEILYIPGTLKLSEALKMMQKEKVHMSAIIDEHGGFEGIITMEDLLEELVGDIWDETDDEDSESKISVQKGSIEISGMTDLDDAFEFLGLHDSDDFYSNTLSGFAIEILDKIPQKDDSFIYENYLFIIEEVENNRIEKLLVKAIKNEKN